MNLKQLLYISDAAENITYGDIEDIHRTSMTNNAIRGITGILFYSQGHFVQFLEGESVAVSGLFNDILQDDRHNAIKLLFDREASKREFEDWDMALLDLNGFNNQHRLDLQDLVHLAGYQSRQTNGDPMDLIILRKFRRLLTPA